MFSEPVCVRAFSIARFAHDGKYRASGEPAFMHCVEVRWSRAGGGGSGRGSGGRGANWARAGASDAGFTRCSLCSSETGPAAGGAADTCASWDMTSAPDF